MLLGWFAWVLFFGFYLLFAGQVSVTEIVAGVPASAAVACFTVLLHRVETRRLHLGGPWWRILGQPLAAVFPDAVRVGRVLLRALWHRPRGALGTVSRQPFRQGGENPAEAARRALVTLGSSLAPNGYVLSIPEGEDVLVLASPSLGTAKPRSGMAAVTAWMGAVLALLPALAVPVLAACHGGTAERLVAVQLATSVASMVLVLMTFAFDQSSFVDLPLTLALLTLPGTLVMALFLERWL